MTLRAFCSICDIIVQRFAYNIVGRFWRGFKSPSDSVGGLRCCLQLVGVVDIDGVVGVGVIVV